jgi:hypothetical protein
VQGVLVGQEGAEIKTIGCYKATNAGQSRHFWGGTFGPTKNMHFRSGGKPENMCFWSDEKYAGNYPPAVARAVWSGGCCACALCLLRCWLC